MTSDSYAYATAASSFRNSSASRDFGLLHKVFSFFKVDAMVIGARKFALARLHSILQFYGGITSPGRLWSASLVTMTMRPINKNFLFLPKTTGPWRWCKHLTGQPVMKFRENSTRTISDMTTGTINTEYENARPFKSIPGPKGLASIPYIGAKFLFKPFTKYSLEEIGFALLNLHETYGPIVRVRLGPSWTVLLEEMSDIQTVLQDKYAQVPHVNTITSVYEKRSKIKSGLLTSTSDEWRRLRIPLNARMNRPSSATHYLASQEQVAVDFANRLPHLQSSPAALQEDCFRFATESIGVVCFNRRLGFLDADFEKNAHKKKLLTSFHTVFECVTKSIFGKEFFYLFFEDDFYKRFKEAFDYIRSYTLTCIEDAVHELQRKEREGTLNPDEPNFLLSLISEKTLDIEDLTNLLVTLMTAGSESTACGVQLLFYSLATNPDKQEKLAEEILGEIGHDGSLTAEVLGRLSYLKASVKESMRINFPLPAGPLRYTNSNVTLSGYQVPKGTRILLSNPRNIMDPRYFENPEQFKPERWLRGEDRQREQVIHYFAFLPFGFGPRNCIGRKFAEQELYLAATKVLQKYKISLREDFKGVEMVFTVFRSPKTPLPFIFTPRN